MKRARQVSLNVPTTGVASGLELAMRFVLWAQRQRHAPSIEQIRDYFDCSRATAYRWRAAWLAANGIHRRAS